MGRRRAVERTGRGFIRIQTAFRLQRMRNGPQESCRTYRKGFHKNTNCFQVAKDEEWAAMQEQISSNRLAALASLPAAGNSFGTPLAALFLYSNLLKMEKCREPDSNRRTTKD